MIGRISFVFALVLAVAFLPAVSFAGGVSVVVPSCKNCVNGGVALAAPVQSYQVPVAVAVPVQIRQQYVQVQAVQAVQLQRVQQVQVVNANKHVRVQVVNQPRTALGAAVQAFRDRRFGR